MHKALVAVLVGLFPFSTVVLFGLTAAYIVSGPERVFEAGGRDATMLWALVVMGVMVIGGWFGGVTCRLFAKSMLPARAFAAVVLLGGIACFTLLATAPAPATRRRRSRKRTS